MPIVINSTEKLICMAMATAIARKLNVPPSNALVQMEKPRDPNWWTGDRAYCVIPGSTAENGGGEGCQMGGALQVKQEFSVFYYGSTKLDPHTFSTTVLLDEAVGSLDRFEQLRQLFAVTYLGNLVNQLLFYVREGKTQWEDPQTGVFSREFVWSGMYARALPFQLTITPADIADVLALQES